MSTLTYKELKKGMRVVLTNPSINYQIGLANPKVGTKWEVVGTVVGHSDGRISVNWDNKHGNSYGDYELSLSCDGRCKSLWDEIGDV